MADFEEIKRLNETLKGRINRIIESTKELGNKAGSQEDNQELIRLCQDVIKICDQEITSANNNKLLDNFETVEKQQQQLILRIDELITKSYNTAYSLIEEEMTLWDDCKKIEEEIENILKNHFNPTILNKFNINNVNSFMNHEIRNLFKEVQIDMSKGEDKKRVAILKDELIIILEIFKSLYTLIYTKLAKLINSNNVNDLNKKLNKYNIKNIIKSCTDDFMNGSKNINNTYIIVTNIFQEHILKKEELTTETTESSTSTESTPETPSPSPETTESPPTDSPPTTPTEPVEKR